MQEYYRYKILKILLKNECNIIRKKWEAIIENTTKIHNNPQKFWSKIKLMKGLSLSNINHLQVDIKIITDDRGKEEAFKEIWSNIFRISPEEYQEYDAIKEGEVKDHIMINYDKCQPYINSDVNKLTQNNETEAVVSEGEIRQTINTFKNNSPGEKG